MSCPSDAFDYDAAKGKNGSNIHIAVDLWGQPSAVQVRLANEQERALVAKIAAKTGERLNVHER